jgi:outer membrane protein assembly factor BamD (BamD/ComL family)
MRTLPISNPRRQKILIIAISILVVAGIAAGTALMLSRFTPVKIGDESNSSQQEPSKTAKQRADELFQKGDYAAAKTQYEIALKEYQASNNTVAAEDVKMQLQIVQATSTKAEKAPQNTDRNRVVMGSQPQ